MKKSKMMNNNKFHIVNPSPWPIIASISLSSMAFSTIVWINMSEPLYMKMSTACLLISLAQWWRDILRESTSQGCHSKEVQKGIIMGMIIFIISEIMFFASVFWALFHISGFPSTDMGMMWPPMGISLFNPLSLPLLNTMILITSGFLVSWSQYSMLNNNHKMMKNSLMATIALGLTFSLIQVFEYKSSSFSIADSAYGSLFFFSTGFHGIHVAVGTVMLMVSFLLMEKNQLSKNHMSFFNFASWYWHFVDVVWIFLYISLYWWPWK